MRIIQITAIVLLSVSSARPQTRPSESGLKPHRFEKELKREVRFNYLLYLPRDYDKQEKWPLIMYLHGGKGRGDVLSLLDSYPLPKMLSQNDNYPFVAVVPQCPAGEMWTDTEGLKALLDSICSQYKIDSDRIYLIGYSMGGTGAWYLAYKYPAVFAAVAPMSGNTNVWWASRLKDIPIWAFHGRKDDRIPASETEEIAGAIEKEGGKIKVTIDPERGHRPPTMTEHEELIKWLLKQRKRQ